jgi:hypothetical protein
MSILFSLLSLFTLTLGFSFYDNFKAPRLDHLNNFCKVFLNQDHRGWSVRQLPTGGYSSSLPTEWTNLTISLASEAPSRLQLHPIIKVFKKSVHIQ